jgi:hypothetical protein
MPKSVDLKQVATPLDENDANETAAEDIHVGFGIRGRVARPEDGRVRFDLILESNELDSASRDDIVVLGSSVRAVQRVRLGQKIEQVLEENDDGEPVLWLEITVSEEK